MHLPQRPSRTCILGCIQFDWRKRTASGGSIRMKPPRFAYERPTTLPEALEALSEHGEDAKVLAGGQSLIPMLNLRLAAPSRLIDLNGVAELGYVVREAGTLRIGSMTRQAVVERSPLVARAAPLLSEALPSVAHAQIRNRGTIGGSVAHADPAAELPVVLCALGARCHIRSRTASRVVDATDFFLSSMLTVLEPDQLLTEVEIPPMPPRSGSSFQEFSRRHGDFALAGAAVRLAVDDDGRCRDAAIVLLAGGPKPRRIADAEAALLGRTPSEAAPECASTAAASSVARDDRDGSAAYRRSVTRHLVEAAVRTAGHRAAETDS